jgi:hypothetical protein
MTNAITHIKRWAHNGPPAPISVPALIEGQWIKVRPEDEADQLEVVFDDQRAVGQHRRRQALTCVAFA